jgi:hypothetical protein
VSRVSRTRLLAGRCKQGGPVVISMGEGGRAVVRQKATVADLMRPPPLSNSRPDDAVSGNSQTRSTVRVMITDEEILEGFETCVAHLDALSAIKVAADCGGGGVD